MGPLRDCPFGCEGKGLLAVKIHLLNDFHSRTSAEGPNPLDFMGVYYNGTSVRLAELKGGKWVAYGDYTLAVNLPLTWNKPHNTNVIPLSSYAPLYCYEMNSGYFNFPNWVQQAAAGVGR